MIKFINNIGEYFSSNYFDEGFIKNVFDKTGYTPEDIKEIQKNISGLKPKYEKYRQTFVEGRLRVKDKITETHKFHTELLNALGYPGNQPEYKELLQVDEKTVLPIRHTLYRGEQPHLMIMEMQSLIKQGEIVPDGLFEQCYHEEENETKNSPQKYHRSQWGNVFTVTEGTKISPMIINKAVSQLFLLDQHRRPNYVLLCAGNQYFLLEQEKWFRGSYLQFDLEELFSEGSIKKDYFALFYFLLAKETLAPQSEIVLMEQLDEDSHKKAYEVTADLKEGVIHAVEAIANEAVQYLEKNGQAFEEIDATQLKDECLTYIYRLLFLFYAESRNDLDILPSDDAVYLHGYSLEMLRELEQVPLNTASSQDGYFFHNSLQTLFKLLSTGYRENETINRSFKVRHLDSPLFNDDKMHILSKVKIKNLVWQDVICQLSLSRQQKGKKRGRISYANLGINQLGSVYESLLAFRGFFAESDNIEVHRKRKANETSQVVVNKDGSFLVPRSRIDDFDPLEIFKENNEEVKIIKKGTFIYRLNGRDRQKSASYYTPEVLTHCTVKYTLKSILERLDKGEIKAAELLELKILEPAMGAAAFHNEVINQLADAYLQYRQQEQNKKVAPDKYREELQKIKAYIALNNVYGVDLNPTAVELGKLSLWLNVIHKDMQTPFFGYRLGTGNAVVGAWLKVFKKKDILFEAKNKRAKKEWWNTAPKHLKFGKNNIKRAEDEIYHFLLPDKNMVPSAGIKLLKAEFSEEAKHVTDWKKEFCKPILKEEYENLQKISSKIDELLEAHYLNQKRVDEYTKAGLEIFGAESLLSTGKLDLRSYEEKEALANQRTNHNAPYYKLKMIMDYWCSLWFWDVRDAATLPTRSEWIKDLFYIINYELTGKETAFDLANYRKKETTNQASEEIAANATKTSLFIDNIRLKQVQHYTKTYSFFHNQLEFIEVFKERGGFDVIAGNPPWLKLTFEEKGLMSEKFPELLIRNIPAPEVRKLQNTFLETEIQKETYFNEFVSTESSGVFMNGYQNYPLLKGQQTNLYKCVLENGFSLISDNGYLGLLHPEGVYDDPNGQILRTEIYKRLKYHFQFINEKKLFAEVHNQTLFSTNIYKGIAEDVDFYSMNNLFEPSTIDSSFIHNGVGITGGYKIKDQSSNKFIWNIKPHFDRIVHYSKNELAIINATFEGGNNETSTKLVSIHANSIISILKKISESKNKVSSKDKHITVCWDETIDVNNHNIEKGFFNIENTFFEKLVYNGPMIHVATPFYKTPRSTQRSNKDYDVVYSNNIAEAGLPNYSFRIINDDNLIEKGWINKYKLCFRKMIPISGERTLSGAIIPKNNTHTNGIISIVFSNEELLVELCALTASIVFDFFLKTIGASNFTDSRLNSFPIGVPKKYLNSLFNRILQLNCLNINYLELWENNWSEAFKQDNWSKQDNRFKPFKTLTKEWQWETPLRNWFERRQSLVEIDVITAMSLGLNLEELILIYNVQFSVLQQNEDDTWYDTTGNIVFTCSKGLTGVGVDRPVWDTIKNLKEGETYQHTIEKSELYYGEKVTYHAPFDKCDRVEDYKTAWTHFENIFKNEEEIC